MSPIKNIRSVYKAIYAFFILIYTVGLLATAPSTYAQYTDKDNLPPYAIFSLFDNLWASGANGINDYGQVCGWVEGQKPAFEPAYWEQTTGIIRFGNFNNSDTGGAADINNLGQVVGVANYNNLYSWAFLWELGGEKVSLGTLGGLLSSATAINDSGQIVGWSAIEDIKPRHAFLYEAEYMLDLGTLEGSGSSAVDINEIGWIVGKSSAGGFYEHAVIWRDGKIIDLGTLYGDGDSQANAINDVNQIVGTDRHFGINHAFLWQNDIMYDLHEEVRLLNAADESYAWQINNNGQVLGWVHKWKYPRDIINAFIWDPLHGAYLIDDFLPPQNRWLSLIWPGEMNDLGQIVGYGYTEVAGNHQRAYLMTPVYPSFDLTKVTPGIAGEINTIRATNVTPGSKVYFLWDNHGGGEFIPGCDITINALQLESPKIAGTAIANNNGIATVKGKIPLSAAGKSLLLQAVIPGDCVISNLIVQEFE